MTFAYVSILCLDIINVTTLICNYFVVAKTPQKPHAKTPQKPRKNLVGKNPAKIFYENINTKTSKISKNFLTLPNILNKHKKL